MRMEPYWSSQRCQDLCRRISSTRAHHLLRQDPLRVFPWSRQVFPPGKTASLKKFSWENQNKCKKKRGNKWDCKKKRRREKILACFVNDWLRAKGYRARGRKTKGSISDTKMEGNLWIFWQEADRYYEILRPLNILYWNNDNSIVRSSPLSLNCWEISITNPHNVSWRTRKNTHEF